jgi:hypothetical protein
MNYLDANHLLERRKYRLVYKIDRAYLWTLPNKGVSRLAKTIADYFRTGNCGRHAVLLEMLSARISA